MSRLLPLFPLQLVVFPGNLVPLHIFEPRYREMVGNAEADGSEFGIVLTKDGGIVNSGCTVVVEKVVNRYPDGRFDVLTRGRRRFHLAALNQEQPCLRGEVEFFDDDDSELPSDDLRNQAWAAFERLRASLPVNANLPLPDRGHPLFSFQAAQEIEDLNFKNLLQRDTSEMNRLREFIRFADEYIPRQQYSDRMKRSAPTNGSGRKPASL